MLRLSKIQHIYTSCRPIYTYIPCTYLQYQRWQFLPGVQYFLVSNVVWLCVKSVHTRATPTGFDSGAAATACRRVRVGEGRV